LVAASLTLERSAKRKRQVGPGLPNRNFGNSAQSLLRRRAANPVPE
jgi:hypothetical protein